MSQVKSARDALKDHIAGLSAVTGRSITPTVSWIPPERDREDIDAAILEVAPAEREVELVSRGTARHLLTLHVALFEPLAADIETQAEANQVLLEAIMDGTIKQAIGTKTCVGVRQIQLQNVKHWREKRLFASVIEIAIQ